jgi:ATP-dependent exoDNAse (exonuclease V) beta subunit
VVTYTVAATEELRDRVRRKIREALEAFTRGDSKDSFLKGLVQKTRDTEDAINLLLGSRASSEMMKGRWNVVNQLGYSEDEYHLAEGRRW